MQPAPNQDSNNSQAHDDSNTSSSDSSVKNQLLDEVLEATLSAGHRQLTRDEWSALRSASQTQGDDMQIVTNMIVVLLGIRFEALLGNRDVLQKMAAQIANTMMADPRSRTRLAEFRQHLANATAG